MSSSTKKVNRPSSANGSHSVCAGCRQRTHDIRSHPLFDIPMCPDCYEHYTSGEFTVEDRNEIYCRWCGQGEGELLLCDTCPKSFCDRCIRNNFGIAEVERIKHLSDRWCCLICSPQPFHDLCRKNEWKGAAATTKGAAAVAAADHRARYQPGIICYDISRGREKFEIPVINTVDDAPAPLNFVYVNAPVAGEGAKLTNNPAFLACCDCTDNCSDPTKCQCLMNSGGSLVYDSFGRLLADKPAGVYECNYRCACHVTRCSNRVVSRGPAVRLELFRCDNPSKGWGVRCKNEIKAGTFVCDYIGEIMPESEAERRGLSVCDEYLFTLDSWGRSMACGRLSELGYKRNMLTIPREFTQDATVTSEEEVKRLFVNQPEFVQMLIEKGAIKRAQQLGEELRQTEQQMQHQQSTQQAQEVRHMTLSITAVAGSNGNSGKVNKQKQQQVSSNNGVNNDDQDDEDDGSSMSSSDHNKKKNKKKKLKIIATNEANNNKKAKKATAASGTASATTSSSSTAATLESTISSAPPKLSWYDHRILLKEKPWETAKSIIQDRCILEAEEKFDSFIIDARWYGSIGRFLNHSCAPNLDKMTVFCESHDVRIPRVAFFASDHIPANTELCYDYGYFEGNVEGKARACLCNALGCRKQLY